MKAWVNVPISDDVADIPCQVIEYMENDLCWPIGCHVKKGSVYSGEMDREWMYAPEDMFVNLYCVGDSLTVIEPGPPCKRICYIIR